MLWILDHDGNPVHLGMDFLEWSTWFEHNNREVRCDVVGGVLVATIFLGIDRSWEMSGKPVLWESMIFGGPLNLTCQCYDSAAAALEGHNELVLLVKNAGEKRI
jgi:hypothetical protein